MVNSSLVVGVLTFSCVLLQIATPINRGGPGPVQPNFAQGPASQQPMSVPSPQVNGPSSHKAMPPSPSQPLNQPSPGGSIRGISPAPNQQIGMAPSPAPSTGGVQSKAVSPCPSPSHRSMPASPASATAHANSPHPGLSPRPESVASPRTDSIAKPLQEPPGLGGQQTSSATVPPTSTNSLTGLEQAASVQTPQQSPMHVGHPAGSHQPTHGPPGSHHQLFHGGPGLSGQPQVPNQPSQQHMLPTHQSQQQPLQSRMTPGGPIASNSNQKMGGLPHTPPPNMGKECGNAAVCMSFKLTGSVAGV